MSKKFSVETTFSAKDHLTGPLRRIVASLNTSFGGIGRRLRSDFDMARKVSTSMFRLGQIGFGAGKAIYSGVTEATQAMDVMAKTSRRAGITIKTFQELEFAASQSGVSFEEFTGGIEKFGKNLGKMKAGSGILNAFLKKVSPTMRQAVLGAEDVDGALAVVFEGLSRLEDPSKRAAFAMAAFGDSGGKMALMTEKGVAGLAAMRKEANDLGIVIDDAAFGTAESFNDELDKLGRVWKGGMRQIGASVADAALPQLWELTAWIKDNKEEFQGFLRDVGKGIVDGVNALVDAGKWIVKNKDSLIDWAKILGTVYLGSMVIPALTATLGLLGRVGALAMGTAGWLGKIAGFGGAAAAAGAGAGGAAAGGAAAGGTIAGLLKFGARFARVAGPIGALASVFDAKDTAGKAASETSGRYQAMRQITDPVTGAWRSAEKPGRERAAELQAERYRQMRADQAASRVRLLEQVLPSAGATSRGSTITIDFLNAPAGLAVQSIAEAPAHNVTVKTRRGTRALGSGSGL